MVAIGDIVSAPLFSALGDRWVVAEARAAMLGPHRDLRLLRGGGTGGGWASVWALESLVEVQQSPTFTIGQRVKVDGLPGEIIAFEADQIPGEARVRVRLDPYRLPLKGGQHLRRADDEVSATTWKLTLENDLHG